MRKLYKSGKEIRNVMQHANLHELIVELEGVVEVGERNVTLSDKDLLTGELVDKLARDSVFGSTKVRENARWILWELGQILNILPTSNHDFHLARGLNEYSGLTVPAINVRAMSYCTARAAFRAALKNNVGAFQFELARNEIGYTEQRPAEYTTVLLAAAIREGFEGPLFILGDHFQINAIEYKKAPEREVREVKDLIKEAVKAGWYSIDFDISTLVDLKKETLDEQQKTNYELSAKLTAYTRSLKEENIIFGIGAEIGEIGGKNSTSEELVAFMDGYNKTLKSIDPNLEGICKIAIQTGTAHGGVVLPEGTLKKVAIDFETLNNLSKIAREKYGLGGAVQHGASTLPEDAFSIFPEKGTCEIHLATQFQNIMYDHKHFPPDLKETMYEYIMENYNIERKSNQTDEQFYYDSREKALGPFKRELWDIPDKSKDSIGKTLEEKFSLIFEKLNVYNTKELVDRLVKSVKVKKYKIDFKEV